MAVIEILALALVVLVILLVIGISIGAFGARGIGASPRPTVALVRVTAGADGHQELQLRVNDQLIRRVSEQGLRPAEYQAAADELEQLASTLAEALGVEVWLRRLEARSASGGEGK
ncbi:MAG: hypothetical protein N2439_09040 [Anaerolineae bacterium]|nr:hypothetical protein [Anaerolineae bacterium]